MDKRTVLRHHIINHQMAKPAENVADTAIVLWEAVATQIISIVGEGGFNSLYTRSVFLVQPTYAWLEDELPADERFVALKRCAAQQTPAQVCAANSLLLITFTDILATLIGELLTTQILRSAWGLPASDQTDGIDLLTAHPKELKHE
ncbi:MAG: hypothetical protein PHI11_06245 [Gallionella sp.]|nr:hypothetical protein [Gallionella sp.]